MVKTEVEESLDLSDFHRVDPVPEAVMPVWAELAHSGNIFRYLDENSEAAQLEKEFAEFMGMKYALGVNSCTSAIMLALLSSGLKPGDRVLIPAFTFIAVPSAVVNLGMIPVLVECNENYCMDLEDFERKARGLSKALLLSYMRGHIPNMDEVMDICSSSGLVLIEDAAHALGEKWSGKLIGTFGKASCFSFQSNKIVNAGEGGMLVTNDEELVVEAIFRSGAYDKFHEKHFVKSDFFSEMHQMFPRFNVRINNLQAAAARPQLQLISEKGAAFRENYNYLVGLLSASGTVEVPRSDPRAERIPDSLQFRIPEFSKKEMRAFIDKVKETKSGGQAVLSLSAVGADPYNDRDFRNWKFIGKIPQLPQTERLIDTTCDMRLLSFWGKAHMDYIADAILSSIHKVKSSL